MLIRRCHDTLRANPERYGSGSIVSWLWAEPGLEQIAHRDTRIRLPVARDGHEDGEGSEPTVLLSSQIEICIENHPIRKRDVTLSCLAQFEIFLHTYTMQPNICRTEQLIS